MNIAYLGPEGTFTHVALQHAVASGMQITNTIEKQSLDQLFDGLLANEYDAIFCPIENSIEGPVNRVLDSITHTNTYIDSLFTMPIQQSLLSFGQPTLQNIEHIVSMPHAIAQCYTFIHTHCPNASIHHATSTTASLTTLEALNLPKNTSVIIGHKGIANLHPINIIETNIQDQKENTTQFCVIKHGKHTTTTPDNNHYCTLAFSTHKDEPGSLLKVLDIFKAHNINLTKILSRPEKTESGTYIFYVEFNISVTNSTIDPIMQRIQDNTLFFKPLGYYKKETLHD